MYEFQFLYFPSQVMVKVKICRIRRCQLDWRCQFDASLGASHLYFSVSRSVELLTCGVSLIGSASGIGSRNGIVITLVIF